MNEMCRIIDNCMFFKSLAHKYIYILLYTSGKTRCNLLDITEEMYYNKQLATEWRNTIFNRIYYCDIGVKYIELYRQKAIDKLDYLYNNMIKED